MTSFHFTLPCNFKPIDVLPPRLHIHADEARYLVHLIGAKMMQRHEEPDFVPLHSKLLRKVIPSPRLTMIVTALKDRGVIEVDSSYVAGLRSKGYKLTQRYLGQESFDCEPVHPGVRERIQRSLEEAQAIQQERWLPIHDELLKAQLGLELEGDFKSVLKTLGAKSRFCQSALVRKICRGEFSFSVSSTGRVFNAITGLKRQLRPFLRLCGEPLGSVDLSCAQPALLSLLMNLEHRRGGIVTSLHAPVGWKGRTTLSSIPLDRLLPLPTAAESCAGPIDRFADLACRGELYELLASLTDLSVADTKLRLLADVFAPKWIYPGTMRQVFESEFPDVAEFIKRVNRSSGPRMAGDHGNLIRILQRLEAELVIHTVCPLLVNHIPVVTLHDAIFCRARDLPIVQGAFDETFRRLNFSMKVKTDDLRHRPSLDDRRAA